MIHDDDGNLYGVAWNETYGIADNFDNIGRYSTQFDALRHAMGEIDNITAITETEVRFMNGSEEVTLTFDQMENTYVPLVSVLADGTPNMFYRTLNDGTDDVDVLVDADGKLCVVNGTTYITKSALDEYVPELNAEKLTALTTAAGGSVAVTLEESADSNMTKITLGSYFFVINQDGYVTFGTISEYRVLVFTVWANQACTEKPSGEIEEAYLKVENEVTLPYGQVGEQLFTEDESDGTRISWYYDFFATVQTINVGDIIKLQAPPGGSNVDGAETEFYE